MEMQYNRQWSLVTERMHSVMGVLEEEKAGANMAPMVKHAMAIAMALAMALACFFLNATKFLWDNKVEPRYFHLINITIWQCTL